MRKLHPASLVALVMFCTAGPEVQRAEAQPPAKHEPFVKATRQAARQLGRDVEILQEDIVATFQGSPERTLFLQTDKLLKHIDHVEFDLHLDHKRQHYYKLVEEIDQDRLAIAQTLKKLGEKGKQLLGDMGRVNAAVDELHYAVSIGEASPDRQKLVARRQTLALAKAARNLDVTATLALGTKQGRGELTLNLGKVAAASAQLAKASAAAEDLAELRDECARVNDAWKRAVLGLSLLPPQDSVYLLRSAGRLDETFGRIFHLLRMPGERARLMVRS